MLHLQSQSRKAEGCGWEQPMQLGPVFAVAPEILQYLADHISQPQSMPYNSKAQHVNAQPNIAHSAQHLVVCAQWLNCYALSCSIKCGNKRNHKFLLSHLGGTVLQCHNHSTADFMCSTSCSHTSWQAASEMMI